MDSPRDQEDDTALFVEEGNRFRALLNARKNQMRAAYETQLRRVRPVSGSIHLARQRVNGGNRFFAKPALPRNSPPLRRALRRPEYSPAPARGSPSRARPAP